MRATVTAGALAEALAFVAKAIPSRVVIPILRDTKIAVDAGALGLVTSDLDQEHASAIAATDCEPGAAVVPCARLLKLVEALPAKAEITLKLTEQRCSISSGRGGWHLPTLNPDDFPQLDGPKDAASFVLAQAEARRVVHRLEHAQSDETNRYYLNGIHLARQGANLVAAATDSYTLAQTVIALDPGRDLDVIIPSKVVKMLKELATHGDVAVLLDDQKIALASGALRCTSKLIDAKFPNYQRLLPKLSGNRVEVKGADLLAALERHQAASPANEITAVGLAWDTDTPLTTCLARGDADAGIEEIAASSRGHARVAVRASFLIETIEAFRADTLTLDHGSANGPVCITAASEPATMMLVMPMAWENLAAVESPAAV